MRRTRPSIASLREEAQHCRACPLWKNATQTVFGAGRATARIVLIGEQPGDREDLAGTNRGHVIKGQSLVSEIAADVIVTVHPSYLLRVPEEDRDSAFDELVQDLKLARKYAQS